MFPIIATRVSLMSHIVTTEETDAIVTGAVIIPPSPLHYYLSALHAVSRTGPRHRVSCLINLGSVPQL
jgi:hypothetical protein